jgi:hypothetical protein
MTRRLAALDLLRTVTQGQLLASTHYQARSIRTSFGMVDIQKDKLASPTAPSDTNRKLHLDWWLELEILVVDQSQSQMGHSPGFTWISPGFSPGIYPWNRCPKLSGISQ